MKTLSWVAVMAAGGLLCTAFLKPIMAEEKPAGPPKEVPKPEKPRDETPEEKRDKEVFKTVVMAEELAQWAKDNKSPEAYVAAGTMLLKARELLESHRLALPPEVSVTDESGKQVKVEEQKKLGDEAEELFLKARDLSKDVANGIAAAKARYKLPQNDDFTEKSPVTGPKRFANVIPSHGSAAFIFHLRPHEPTVVAFQASAPVQFVVWEQGVGFRVNHLATHGQIAFTPRGPINQKILEHVRLISHAGVPIRFVLHIQ